MTVAAARARVRVRARLERPQRPIRLRREEQNFGFLAARRHIQTRYPQLQSHRWRTRPRPLHWTTNTVAGQGNRGGSRCAVSTRFALGAWQWDPQQRQIFANDPIELIPVSKAANRQKSDSGLDEWLPTFQPCAYIQRYLTVAAKYQLPITAAEHTVATTTCPAAAAAPAA